MELSQKSKNKISIWSKNFISDYRYKGIKLLSQRDICTSVYCSIIYNSQDMKTTWAFMDRWTDKENMCMYTHTVEYYLAIKGKSC